MSELKPCPFCGSPAKLEKDSDHHGEFFSLGCSRLRQKDSERNCIGSWLFYTESVTETSIDEAIAMWNSRPAEGGEKQ